MKISNILLAGAAASALFGGAAFGQANLTLRADNVNQFGASLVIASERDLTSAAVNAISGAFDVQIGSGAAPVAFPIASIGATDTIDVEFTLTGDLVIGAPMSNANVLGANATCVMTIQSGGTVGSKSVLYRVVAGGGNDATSCAANDLAARIPVSITGAGNVTAAVRLTATQAPLLSATFDALPAAGIQGLVRRAAGFAQVFAGNTGTYPIALTATNPYQTFANPGTAIATVQVNDSAGAGATNGVLQNATNAALTGTNVASATQVASGQLVVTFPQPTGIASATLGLAAPATVNLTAAGTATFPLTSAQLAELRNTAINIIPNAATAAAAAPIANQQPTAQLTLTAATGSLVTLAPTSANTQRLVRQGSNSANFEWVNDGSLNTGNVFRFTGIGATLPAIRATFSASSNGATFNREVVLSPSQPLQNGELIVTSADLGAANGAFGRANVAFSVEANGVTVRRFNITNGVVSSMASDSVITCTAQTGTAAAQATGGEAQALSLSAQTCTQ